jgi:ABC-type lipoprotein export system ATPase subunit
MKFQIISQNAYPPQVGTNTCYLETNNWNDYSFVTTFALSLHDEEGHYHKIGNVRIGFLGQTEEIATYQKLDNIFDDDLPPNFFSLGMDSGYYKELSKLKQTLREKILTALKDVVFSTECLKVAENESVFSTALLRDTSITTVKGKYTRILSGAPELTEFKFAFSPEDQMFGGKNIKFNVNVGSTPSTNVHAIIGTNGTGKTTFFNKMVDAIIEPKADSGKVIKLNEFGASSPIGKNYFSSLTSISFSAFDTFIPPKERSNPAKGTCYFYLGLKKIAKDGQENTNALKTIDELREDMCEGMLNCFYDPQSKKIERFKHVIKLLSTDQNIKSLDLKQYHDEYLTLKPEGNQSEAEFRIMCRDKFLQLLPPMSSGHMIVLLSAFSLIATVDDRSLVLIDEPESHLHPPLLSAFIRALSWLLHQVNGVAIIATHSPVVLQEIPSSSVWKVMRSGNETKAVRPDIETFGENVGTLTREVFGLDIDKSGFITVLQSAVETGKSFEYIYKRVFKKRIGGEGLILLRTLIDIRDRELAEND